MSHGTVHCTANVQRGTTRLNTLSASIPTEFQGHIAINVQRGNNELGHTFWFCSYWTACLETFNIHTEESFLMFALHTYCSL